MDFLKGVVDYTRPGLEARNDDTEHAVLVGALPHLSSCLWYAAMCEDRTNLTNDKLLIGV